MSVRLRAAAVLTLCLGAGAAAAGAVDVTIEEDRLSLSAEAAPLADVLHAVGDAGGFAVVLRGDLSQPVDLAVEDQPIDQALQELLRDHSLILRRDPESGALIEMRVIASRSPDPSPPAGSKGAPALGKAAGDTGREAFRLAHLGTPAPTREELRAALTHEDGTERVAAVPKVGSLVPDAALDLLGDVLAEDEDPLVRSRAVAALTRFEGDAASELLRTAALDDSDPEIRIQALNALAASPNAQRRTTALARAMRDDPEQEVRRTALLALQRIGGAWARSYLERRAPRLEPELRELAEQALLDWPDTD